MVVLRLKLLVNLVFDGIDRVPPHVSALLNHAQVLKRAVLVMFLTVRSNEWTVKTQGK